MSITVADLITVMHSSFANAWPARGWDADELQKLSQQLALDLATARASVAAQEQIVGNMLQRLTATSAEPDLAVTKQAGGTIQGTRRVAKNPIETGT